MQTTRTMIRLLTILTIIPLTIFSQDNDSTKTRKFSIGLTFSPDYCKTDNGANDFPEVPAFGYTAGLNLVYNLNKRVNLETGLFYFDKVEKTKKYDLTFYPSNPSNPTKNAFTWHNIYVGIPIKIHYCILTKRIKLYVTAGISANILLTEKATSVLEYSDGHTKTSNSTYTGSLSDRDFAGITGLCIGYALSDKFAMKIEPTYRHFLSSTFRAPVHSAGLEIGLYFKL